MYCKKCGKVIDVRAKFCTFCGTATLLSPSHQTVHEVVQSPQPKKVKETNRHFKNTMIVGAIIVFVTAAYGAIAYVTLPRFPLHPKQTKVITLAWTYKGTEYKVDETVSAEAAQFYSSNKIKTNDTVTPEEHYWRRLFQYGVDPKDSTISDLARKIESDISKNNLPADSAVELATTLVQSLPYDDDKYSIVKQYAGGSTEDIGTIKATWPRLPYETLYDKTGICTDKSLLLAELLSKLGYGVALIDYPKHLAAAVQCPQAVSTYGSGYCYIESTTEGFIVGELPTGADGTGSEPNTLAADPNTNTETSSTGLGTPSIIPLTKGRSYERATELSDLLTEQRNLAQEIDDKRTWFPEESQRIDDYKADEVDAALTRSNNAYQTHEVFKDPLSYSTYKNLYNVYSSNFGEYKAMIRDYNDEVEAFNKKVDRWKEISAQLSYK